MEKPNIRMKILQALLIYQQKEVMDSQLATADS